jgi:uncharacterized protein (DUF2252 family)
MARTSPSKRVPDQRTAHPPSDERREEGRALRDTAPRASHAGWKPPAKRSDPIDILVASNAGRLQTLIPIRFARMAESPFAFYRGAAAVMAADLAHTPATGLRVQACGDAHLMNFGGFATPERNIVFDINDLDETLPAPWEWDLKRLAASVVIAGQHLGFAGSDVARLAVDVAREYRERIADYAHRHVLDVWYDKIDQRRFEERAAEIGVLKEARAEMETSIGTALRKSTPEILFPKLVEARGAAPRIKDEPPLIFHPSDEIAPGIESGFAQALGAYRESLAPHVRLLVDRFRLADFALKVVGVGSVGTICGVCLFLADDDDPLFLQVKQARESVLEPYAGKSVYANHGQRVVEGQRLMQTASDLFLGWMQAQDGNHYYVRQLRDVKVSPMIENWSLGLLRLYVRMCAAALARAHARSGDGAKISGYLGTSRTMDDAIGEFAMDYADQNRADHRAFVRAIKEGRIEAAAEA